jgi:hypothetical protein
VRPYRVRDWGSTAAERARPYPCDELMPATSATLFRAIDISAPPAAVYRWLCQLRVAPYSYDWIDNLGRRSPPTLTPGLDELQVGQRVMTVFRLASFEANRQLTILSRPRFGPDSAITYLIVESPENTSRLIMKMIIDIPRVLLTPFATADLVMARKQLQTLAALATTRDQ